MHGHTTELVTNLLLPGIYDVRSVARSKAGQYPLDSIDIIDGDDYDRHECVDRLRSAMQEPKLQQLILSEIFMDEDVIEALVNLLKSSCRWNGLYLEFCEGELGNAIESILSLENVSKIELAGSLSPERIATLSKALSRNRSLEELSLLVTLNDENVRTLINGLKQSTSLRRLKFVKSTLHSESIEPLSDFLSKDNKFDTIHFDRCNVADNDIATLLNSLEEHSMLKELFVGGNSFGSCLHSALSNLLSRNKLHMLSMHSYGQVSSESLFDTTWMMRSLKQNTSLRVLDLSENSLDDEGLAMLVQAFCSNSTLEEVRFHGNRITNAGARLFGRNMGEMRGLKRIFMHRNRFDEDGAKQMLDGVRRNDEIEELTIPTMGRNMKMSIYQKLISHQTCLNSGGRKLLRNRQISLNLWPRVFERARQHLWTPYCEYQMQSLNKWKHMQQADIIFYFIRSTGNFGR